MRVAGVIVTALGVIAFVVSVLQMKDNWRAGVQREEKTSLVVNVEEDFLIEVFEEEYVAYKKKVCRYIGRRI